jgi:hypothetical protein
MSYGLIERTPTATYQNSSVSHDYVEFKELNLRGQSAYNPAVSGLAAFIRKHGNTHEGAESIALNLVRSEDRHFAATDAYGLNTGRVFAHGSTTSLEEVMFAHSITTPGGSLAGEYRRTAAGLLYCALQDETHSDRPFVASVATEDEREFYLELGMNVYQDVNSFTATAGSLAHVYHALERAYELTDEMRAV